MTKEELALEVIDRLKKEYPDAGCTLDYNQAWKLLVSVRLAAQCTDARVNVVVKGLFEKYPNVAALADVASLFFIDERERALSYKFITGSLIAIIGSFIFVFNGYSLDSGSFSYTGFIFLTIAICIQSIQNVIVKIVAQYLPAIVISASTATISGLMFLLLAIKTGVITELSVTSKELLIYLVLAGIYGMMTGMLMAFYIVKTQGVTIFNITQLLIPVSTGIFGYITLGEKVDLIQATGAVIIIASCIFATKR